MVNGLSVKVGFRMDGKGGAMASMLKDNVLDLTVLAKSNKGLFPTQSVRKMIEGEAMAGPIFQQIEHDQDWGA